MASGSESRPDERMVKMKYAVYRRCRYKKGMAHIPHWNRVYENGKPKTFLTLEEAKECEKQYDPEEFETKIKEVKK